MRGSNVKQSCRWEVIFSLQQEPPSNKMKCMVFTDGMGGSSIFPAIKQRASSCKMLQAALAAQSSLAMGRKCTADAAVLLEIQQGRGCEDLCRQRAAPSSLVGQPRWPKLLLMDVGTYCREILTDGDPSHRCCLCLHLNVHLDTELLEWG